MSDFLSNGWSIWISAVTIIGIIFVLWLLWTQRSFLGTKTVVDDTGHEWDGVRELNHPVPRWWTVMYLGLCVIGVAIMILYPALGTNPGLRHYHAATEVANDFKAYEAQIKPVYAKFEGKSVEELAKDPQAHEIGERLFLNTCSQCHGSTATGNPNFPNLTDNDWLGDPNHGSPEYIEGVIRNGRMGVMAPLAAVVSVEDSKAVASYVRSLSGLGNSDPTLIAKGDKIFHSTGTCFVCHGADAKGNPTLGAPNLTDSTWLNSGSEDTIIHTIQNGRTNIMPPQAQAARLTDDQVKVLTAYVWSLSHK